MNDPLIQWLNTKIPGIYEWKGDGVHTDGQITLNTDGTIDQYH